MKQALICVCLLAVPAWAASWESFPLRENGSIAVWTVAGPLPNAQVETHGKNCVGYYTDYLKSMGGEAAVVPAEGDRIAFGDGASAVWQSAFSDQAGRLNYRELFGLPVDVPGVAYAFCLLASTWEQSAVLKIRSDDGVRVWLNGKMVHDHHVGRGIDAEEDRVAVSLRQGDNRLLVKVDQSNGDWGLGIEIVKPDGKPLEGVTSQVAVAAPIAGTISTVKLMTLPVMARTSGVPRQSATLEIVSGGLRDATARISMKQWPEPEVCPLGDVPIGRHRVDVQLPPVSESGPASVEIRSPAVTREFPNMMLNKLRPWVVYLVQHTHTDIGYTRTQAEILPDHLRFIDYALDYCDLTDAYPDDAKFRWTCEVSWTVNEYLKRRPPEQVERLKKRIAEGRIEVAGMLLNMAEVATESSLAASLQPIRTLKDKAGIPIRLAMQNDVNGAAWCLADYFADIGVKYMVMGINETRSLVPFDKPTAFWWESPAGRRVLAFRPDHYHLGNVMKIHGGNLDAFQLELLAYLRSLEQRDYPSDRISIQFSGYYADNSPPATHECDLVKTWNEKYASPRLRMATASEFMDYVATHHGEKLAVHREAWPDWWTDGFGSAARETGESRQTHVNLQATQGLLAMATLAGTTPSRGVKDRMSRVQESLLFYDEHTYGASMSVSDPMHENTMVQWGQKGSYVWDAAKRAKLLREEALGDVQGMLPRVDVPTLAIFNTLNWKRSGLAVAFIDNQFQPPDRAARIIEPETGEVLLAQPMECRPEGTYWAVWVKDVPPLGYRSYRIERSDAMRTDPPATDAKAGTIENAFYAIKLHPKTGAITSLRDKEISRELVDPTGPWQFGQPIYERLEGGREFRRDAFLRTTLRDVGVEGGSGGPIFKSVVVQANLDGCAEPNGIRTEIRLYETEKRVEFHFDVRKLPIREPEAVYVAFPFQWADGEVFYEAQGGLVSPGRNQLPSSSSDWQTVQNFVAVRGKDGQIIWGSDRIPLVQFGDINLGKWQPIAKVERPHVYSWVMNNYWFTNFRATQEGEFKWSYYLTSTRETGNAPATRFGWGSRVPLVSRVLPPGKVGSSKTSLSLLQCDAPNLLLVESRPAWDGKGLILHWREVEGKNAALGLSHQPFASKVRRVDEVNAIEQTLKENVSSLSFGPYEVKFLRLVPK